MLALLVALVCPVTLAADAVGLITAVSGDVTLIRPGVAPAIVPQVMAELLPDDTLSVGSGGQASLLLRDGRIVSVAQNTRYPIAAAWGDTSVGVGTGKVPAGSSSGLYAFIAERDQTINKLLVRGEEDSLDLVLLVPGNTSLASDCPNFIWNAYDSAQVYSLSVQQMGKAVWTVMTVDTFMGYPSTKERLEPGVYLVRVCALVGQDTLARTDRSIKILGAEEIASVADAIRALKSRKPDPFTLGLLSAKIYEQSRLRMDALREYQQLLMKEPKVSYIHKALSALYNELGIVPRGNYHLERYEELTRP